VHAIAPRQPVIGPAEPEWDLVLLVGYPSRAKFIEMATNPEYLKIHAHREAALADSRLIACSEVPEQAPGQPVAGAQAGTPGGGAELPTRTAPEGPGGIVGGALSLSVAGPTPPRCR